MTWLLKTLLLLLFFFREKSTAASSKKTAGCGGVKGQTQATRRHIGESMIGGKLSVIITFKSTWCDWRVHMVFQSFNLHLWFYHDCEPCMLAFGIFLRHSFSTFSRLFSLKSPVQTLHFSHIEFNANYSLVIDTTFSQSQTKVWLVKLTFVRL